MRNGTAPFFYKFLFILLMLSIDRMKISMKCSDLIQKKCLGFFASLSGLFSSSDCSLSSFSIHAGWLLWNISIFIAKNWENVNVIKKENRCRHPLSKKLRN